jgi:hypothetical protein
MITYPIEVRKAVGSCKPARRKIAKGWTMPCTIMPSASSISTRAARPNMARDRKATACSGGFGKGHHDRTDGHLQEVTSPT